MKTILVIDDDKLIREVFVWRLGLQMTDCKVLTAANGQEGIEVMNRVPIDFIMTDLLMPVVDGYGVIGYRNENFPQVPVFVMTGAYSASVQSRLNEMSVEHCYEKPFDFDEVAGTIQRTLAEKSMMPVTLPAEA